MNPHNLLLYGSIHIDKSANIIIMCFKAGETYIVKSRRFIYQQNLDNHYSRSPLPQRALLEVIIKMQQFACWGPRKVIKVYTKRHINCYGNACICSWNLANVPEVAYELSGYSRVLKLTLFSLCRQQFLRCRPIVKIAHKTWRLAKVTGIVCVHPFYPLWLKLVSLSFYGQWFPRYGPIFKIATFGHET